MNDKFSECQTPFTKCWCEDVPSVSIQSDFLTLLIVAGILFYMWRIFKIKL